MSFSVIIPSKNATNLAACIGAIREAREIARIIVVDDGVDRGSSADWDEDTEWVLGIKPFVFARNVNLGIQAAGDDDVILLNDDALLKTDHGFTELAEQAARGKFGLIAASCDTVGEVHQFRQLKYADSGKCRELPRMACFVCVYIPRSTISAVGLLDERFGAIDDQGREVYGFCDDDYCYRVRMAGLKLSVFDGCYVDHNSLESSFRHDKPRSLEPGQRLFIKKHGVDNWMHGKETSQWRHLFE